MKYLGKVLAISVLVGCSSVAMAACESENSQATDAWRNQKNCLEDLARRYSGGSCPEDKCYNVKLQNTSEEMKCKEPYNTALDNYARCCGLAGLKHDVGNPWELCKP